MILELLHQLPFWRKERILFLSIARNLISSPSKQPILSKSPVQPCSKCGFIAYSDQHHSSSFWYKHRQGPGSHLFRLLNLDDRYLFILLSMGSVRMGVKERSGKGLQWPTIWKTRGNLSDQPGGRAGWAFHP